MNRWILILLFLSSSVPALAQQDPQFTQYMFNNQYYNPGFSGVEGTPKASFLFRSQWSGYQPTTYGGGAPTSELLTYSSPVAKLKGGFGAYILNDNLGPMNNIAAQATYAYHFKIKDAKLSLGIGAGFYSQKINSDLYKAINEEDPLLPAPGTGPYTQTKPDLSAGVFFNKEKFYVGAGFSHLINAKFDFGLGQDNKLETHMYVTGGYMYEVNFDLRVQFVTMVKSDFVKTQYDVGAIAYLKDNMWGGLSFRQSEAAIVLLGYNILKDKSLKVGYSMDIIVRDKEAKQPLSHEIMVTYQLPITAGVGMKVIRTPRYRH